MKTATIIDHHAIARIATMLGRQHRSQAMIVKEIADDATRLAEIAAAIPKTRRKAELTAAARRITDRYEAELVEGKPVDGKDAPCFVLAIKFRSGLYSSAHRNLFFLA